LVKKNVGVMPRKSANCGDSTGFGGFVTRGQTSGWNLSDKFGVSITKLKLLKIFWDFDDAAAIASLLLFFSGAGV